MKYFTFKGIFKSYEGHEYELTCNCFSFFEAFFILTAEAIKSGNHYQLYTITKEEDNTSVKVDDIMKCGALLL